MADRQPAGKSVVALILMASALTLSLLAGLILFGVVPLPEESRGIASLVVGVAAAADFGIGLWLFRAGQSS